jgi:choline monooxygenase
MSPSLINPDHTQAATLPVQFYTDPDMLKEERTKVFNATWQYATSLDMLKHPGSFVAVDVLGTPVVVTRGTDGVVRAFYNICRHRAGVVAKGFGNRKSLQCQYHGWLYGLDGTLKNAPEMEGTQNFDPCDFSLMPIRTATWGNFVFVNLDGNAPDLLTVLGKIPQETSKFRFDKMRSMKRHDYFVDANWKVYIDNYLEGYHVPIAHPGLYREIDYAQYRVDTFRYYSSQYAPIRPTRTEDKSGRVYITMSGDDQALYYWIFPNFMLNIYMGMLQINVVVPLSHDRTKVIFEWFYSEDAPPESWDRLNDSIEFSDEIQREDAEICDAVWRNMQVGVYTQGRFCAQRENGVHHFQSLYSEFIQA